MLWKRGPSTELGVVWENFATVGGTAVYFSRRFGWSARLHAEARIREIIIRRRSLALMSSVATTQCDVPEWRLLSFAVLCRYILDRTIDVNVCVCVRGVLVC